MSKSKNVAVIDAADVEDQKILALENEVKNLRELNSDLTEKLAKESTIVMSLKEQLAKEATVVLTLKEQLAEGSDKISELESQIQKHAEIMQPSKLIEGKIKVLHGVVIGSREYSKKEIESDSEIQIYLLEIGSEAVQLVND
ncbi:hypothetical protein ACR777_15145 [Sphingobacterium spiritivorum]|uniref:hypothetical protein n=1 Tax=Sphingobacterium spiritivorum TaxID=258 RepID=UPI003DA4634A